MKRTQLIIAALFLLVLLGIGMATTVPPGFGAVPPAGWAGALCLVLFTGLALVVVDTRRSRGKVLAAISRASQKTAPSDKGAAGLSESVIVNPVGPSYPHPVINVATCERVYSLLSFSFIFPDKVEYSKLITIIIITVIKSC